MLDIYFCDECDGRLPTDEYRGGWYTLDGWSRVCRRCRAITVPRAPLVRRDGRRFSRKPSASDRRGSARRTRAGPDASAPDADPSSGRIPPALILVGAGAVTAILGTVVVVLLRGSDAPETAEKSPRAPATARAVPARKTAKSAAQTAAKAGPKPSPAQPEVPVPAPPAPKKPSGRPPSIDLLGPTQRDRFDEGDEIRFRVFVTDPDGDLDRVEYYAGDEKIGESKARPYAYTWKSASPGRLALTARAIDRAGHETSTPALRVRVRDRASILAAIEAAKKSVGRGLLMHWKLDASSGSEAADASGNGKKGTLRGKPQWKPGQGRRGGALLLDGKDDLIDGGKIDAGAGAKPRTIAAWVKASRTSQPKNQTIFGFSAGGRNLNNTHFDVMTSDTGQFSLRWYGGRLNMAPIDTQWHHVAAVYDGKIATAYFDGKRVARETRALNTRSQFRVGRRTSSRTPSFAGWLDDVRVYGRVLNDAEILALYTGAGEDGGGGASPGTQPKPPTPTVTALTPPPDPLDELDEDEDDPDARKTDPKAADGGSKDPPKTKPTPAKPAKPATPKLAAGPPVPRLSGRYTRLIVSGLELRSGTLLEQKGWKTQAGHFTSSGKGGRTVLTRQKLSAGDFHIRLRMRIKWNEDNDRSVELIFGKTSRLIVFDKSGDKIQVGKPLTGGKRPKDVGKLSEYVQAGKTFTLDIVQTGDTVVVGIDGKTISTWKHKPSALGRIGVRSRGNFVGIAEWTVQGKWENP